MRGVGPREGMMDGMPALLLDAMVQEREVDDPEEVESVGVDR